MSVKRNILLNPGPSTTTDTVKYAQVVPDICPREEEFQKLMQGIRNDLLKVVHANPEKYTSVLFCGSGTLNMDVCLNSLLPAEKSVLVINNGAYSSRAVEICEYYNLPHIDLQFADNQKPDLNIVQNTLKEHPEIALVYITHHETGTGLLNPIREIGRLAHQYGATFIVDTTSSLAMIPIDIEADEIDFCMASAQKGLMSMTGLSFVIGNRQLIEASKEYPKRSYYCNLYMQYDYFERTGEMHFTPPVQTIYATRQAMDEYFSEGELPKWNRHYKTYQAIRKGIISCGMQTYLKEEDEAGLVVTVLYPDWENWSFQKLHDDCYAAGYTIYPGKVSNTQTFRLCSLGAIYEGDIHGFMEVFKKSIESMK